MKVTKDSILEIKHDRKGQFTAIATNDFDTEKDTFYPVKTTACVEGMVNEWDVGESIPCRGSLCSITVIRAGA